MNHIKPLMLLSLLCLCLPALAQGRKVIVPANAAKPVGPYSPGIMHGDYLYVSGQGARDASGNLPDGIAAQTRQCLENVKGVVTAAGLTLDHVVHIQLYLERLSDLPAVERVYTEYFPKAPPARVVLGVTKMPTDTTVEMTAVAVRKLGAKKVLALPSLQPFGHASSAVAAGNRIYLSGIYGTTALEVLSRLAQVLKEARANEQGLLWRNEYSTTGRVGVPMRELPEGATLAASVVALKQPAKSAGPCRADGKTVYCSVQEGSGAPDVQAQVKWAMQQLQNGLAAHGATLAQVTASNVYLDDINEFRQMNETYASFFKDAPPTRTTVQPFAPAERSKGSPPIVRIAVVAVRD
mgnify:CR=1 FL=1